MRIDLTVNSEVTPETTFNEWRKAACNVGLDVDEHDHSYWLTITNALYPERGMLHVRLDNDDDGLPCGVSIYGASGSDPWAKLSPDKALATLGRLHGGLVTVKPWVTAHMNEG